MTKAAPSSTAAPCAPGKPTSPSSPGASLTTSGANQSSGETRAYSPSDTEDFQRCPRFRQLRKGWDVHHNPWKPSRLLGDALHAGLAQYYAHEVEETALLAMGAKLDALFTLEAAEAEKSGFTVDGLTKIGARVLKKVIETGVQVPPETVVGTELWIAGCRADLVTRTGEGLVVTEHKFTMSADADIQVVRLAEYEASWQLYHQAWAVSQHFGETPISGRIQLMVATPRVAVRLEPVVTFTEAKLAAWAASAEFWWDAMRRTDATYGRGAPAPGNFGSCFTKFGRCDYFDVCHHGGQPEALYTARVRR
jgi:hypothetical protein